MSSQITVLEELNDLIESEDSIKRVDSFEEKLRFSNNIQRSGALGQTEFALNILNLWGKESTMLRLGVVCAFYD